MKSGDYASFTEAEQAALRFADLMTLNSRGIGDAEFAELRRHWDEGEVIELASVIGLFNYFNRFTNALRVEITR